MRYLIILAALAASAAQAQNYDVDIVMQTGKTPTDFVGSFTYANGVLSDVDVLTNVGGVKTAFTAGTYSGGVVSLFDYQGYTPAEIGSSAWLLELTPKTSLASGRGGLQGAEFIEDWNLTGIASCGTPPGIDVHKCSTMRLTDPPAGTVAKAPELDGSRAIAALTLLAGAALVLKSSRRQARI
jgi:hypothetical protein